MLVSVAYRDRMGFSGSRARKEPFFLVMTRGWRSPNWDLIRGHARAAARVAWVNALAYQYTCPEGATARDLGAKTSVIEDLVRAGMGSMQGRYFVAFDLAQEPCPDPVEAVPGQKLGDDPPPGLPPGLPPDPDPISVGDRKGELNDSAGLADTDRKIYRNKEDRVPDSELSGLSPGALLADEIATLSARYQTESLSAIRDSIALTRKTGKIADSVWVQVLRKLAKHPLASVEHGAQVFLDKHADGEKGEGYLLAIVRNHAKRAPKEGAVTLEDMKRKMEAKKWEPL